ICKEVRPEILKGTPICYANMLKRCWHQGPKKLPSALEVYETVTSWKNDPIILSEFLNSENDSAIEDDASTINVDSDLIHF
ncbi:24448_t:CDS:1, partial [Cetraspora pellucida]